MLSNILNTLSLARHVISITLVAGAATTMVAGSVDSVSTAQRQAPKTEVSSQSAQHDETTVSDPGKGARKMGIDLLVIDCLTKYAAARTTNDHSEAAGEACRKAIEESGLSAEDFWAKFATKAKAIIARQETPKTEPQKKPDTTTKKTEPQPNAGADIETLVKDCFAKYSAANSTPNSGTIASEACHKATLASGLTTDEFFKKFGKPEAPKKAEPQQPTTSANLETLVRECQAKYAVAVKTPEGADGARQACMKAVTASGMSVNDFWAKYMQQKAEQRPDPNKKTEPTTNVSITELVKYCTTLKSALTSTSSRADIEKTGYVCAKAGLALN